jgi:hypothetical protein
VDAVKKLSASSVKRDSKKILAFTGYKECYRKKKQDFIENAGWFM